MNSFYGAKGPLDYLYIYKDPGTYGQLTPNTVVQYIVNFYDYEKLGPMVMELPGKQIIQMAEDFDLDGIQKLADALDAC
jgi:hypothetical protein